MARSDSSSAVSLSVALLLAALGSVLPAGAVTVAVLTRLAVAEDRAVPVTVNTTELGRAAATVRVAARLVAEPRPTQRTEAGRGRLDVHVTPDTAAGRT